MPDITLRQQYIQRWGALQTERSSWITQWRELSEFVQPRTGRFLASDRNRGDKRYNSIINECGSRALRVLAAGLMSGLTSPARPWFRLSIGDTDLGTSHDVQEWLGLVTKIMRDVFNRSNTYRALHSIYREIGLYGTAADVVRDDFTDILRHYPLTAGEYAIAANQRGEVDTLYREFDMTVAQIVAEFVRPTGDFRKSGSWDWEIVSPAIKSMWDLGKGLDSWVRVLSVIEPRADRDMRSPLSKDMAYASCYLEYGGNNDKFLRESGFTHFPGLCPRWDTSGGDIYGDSPGMEALGSVKQLQHGESRKSLAIDYGVKPPLRMPASLKNQPLATLPGGVIFNDSVVKIEPLFAVNFDIADSVMDIQRIEGRIQKTFYSDLFLMLAQSDQGGVQPVTAREVAERHEEKLLMLGPVLERLHNELLKPYIDLTFDRMIASGIVPPPPPELQGTELSVQFVSVLAQAQQMVGVGNVNAFMGTVGTIATYQANSGRVPDVLDKLNTDKIVDDLADMYGVDPSFIVADDKVAIIRQQRAQAQQAQQQQAAAANAANIAKTAGDVNVDNARDVMAGLTGYTT